MHGSPHESASRYHFSDNIPENYGEAIINVLPCNPFRIYLYWDLPELAADTASRWCLRYFINEACSNPGNNGIQEIEILPTSREWYLDLPFQGESYTIELIRETSDGIKAVVLQSGHRLPAATMPANASLAGQPAAPAINRPTDGLITTSAMVQKSTPPADIQTAPGGAATADKSYPTSQPSSWALQGTSS